MVCAKAASQHGWNMLAAVLLSHACALPLAAMLEDFPDADAANILEDLQAANKQREAADVDTAGEGMMRAFATILQNSFLQVWAPLQSYNTMLAIYCPFCLLTMPPYGRGCYKQVLWGAR
jgi:hypothetical protein